MACRVRDYRAAPSRRNRADRGALAAAPAVHSVAADGRLRVRSASRPLHSQSLSLVGTLSDSSSPSFEGDRVSLQLWGDIILEHLHSCRTHLAPAADSGIPLVVPQLCPASFGVLFVASPECSYAPRNSSLARPPHRCGSPCR